VRAVSAGSVDVAGEQRQLLVPFGMQWFGARADVVEERETRECVVRDARLAVGGVTASSPPQVQTPSETAAILGVLAIPQEDGGVNGAAADRVKKGASRLGDGHELLGSGVRRDTDVQRACMQAQKCVQAAVRRACSVAQKQGLVDEGIRAHPAAREVSGVH
jgi:hypothetical protein